MARRRIRNPLLVPRFRARRLVRRVRAAVSGVRPRAGRAVERDPRPESRRRADRDGARTTWSATCADRGRRPSARSSTTCARPRSIRVSGGAAEADRVRVAVTGRRSRKCATRSSTSRSPASRSTRTSNTAAIASTTWRPRPIAIFLMPSSPLDSRGVATYELFLRGTLDKIGVVSRPPAHRRLQDGVQHIHRKGLHAGAPRDGESLNRDWFDQLVQGVAEGRKKPEADVRALIDDGPFLPEGAVTAGLIDEVAYEDQIDDDRQRPARDRDVSKGRLRSAWPVVVG